mgnify:CR=1 FL=1
MPQPLGAAEAQVLWQDAFSEASTQRKLGWSLAYSPQGLASWFLS